MKKLICSIFLIMIILSTAIMPCFANENSDNDEIIFTAEESNYIKNHPEISIAIDTSWVPYGFMQSNDTCGGIIPNPNL